MIMREREQAKKLLQLYRTLNKERRGVGVTGGGWWVVVGGWWVVVGGWWLVGGNGNDLRETPTTYSGCPNLFFKTVLGVTRKG